MVEHGAAASVLYMRNKPSGKYARAVCVFGTVLLMRGIDVSARYTPTVKLRL